MPALAVLTGQTISFIGRAPGRPGWHRVLGRARCAMPASGVADPAVVYARRQQQSTLASAEIRVRPMMVLGSNVVRLLREQVSIRCVFGGKQTNKQCIGVWVLQLVKLAKRASFAADQRCKT